MTLNEQLHDPVQILLSDDPELLPRQLSAAAAGQLVVRGYVLDPEDCEQPRFRIMVRSAPLESKRHGGVHRAGLCAPDATRRWQTAAAQAASGKMRA